MGGRASDGVPVSAGDAREEGGSVTARVVDGVVRGVVLGSATDSGPAHVPYSTLVPGCADGPGLLLHAQSVLVA